MYRYDETVSFHPVVQLVCLGGMGVLVWAQLTAVPDLPWVAVAVGVPLLILPLMFGRLRIRIDATTLSAEFGYLGWPAQRIALSSIVGARVAEYRPIRDLGGWGIRAGRLDGEQTSVYTVRGSTGVIVELADEKRISGFRTKRFLIGSQKSESLVAAIGKP